MFAAAAVRQQFVSASGVRVAFAFGWESDWPGARLMVGAFTCPLALMMLRLPHFRTPPLGTIIFQADINVIGLAAARAVTALL